MAGTFFLPFGYDIVFKTVFDWTDSYWITTSIFYLVSAVFFGLYVCLSKAALKSSTTESSPSHPSEIEESLLPSPDEP